MPKTLFDKIWDAHEVAPRLLYVDLHLVHEVTSPQAFDGLRLNGRKVRRSDRTLATAPAIVARLKTTAAAGARTGVPFLECDLELADLKGDTDRYTVLAFGVLFFRRRAHGELARRDDDHLRAFTAVLELGDRTRHCPEFGGCSEALFCCERLKARQSGLCKRLGPRLEVGNGGFGGGLIAHCFGLGST